MVMPNYIDPGLMAGTGRRPVRPPRPVRTPLPSAPVSPLGLQLSPYPSRDVPGLEGYLAGTLGSDANINFANRNFGGVEVGPDRAMTEAGINIGRDIKSAQSAIGSFLLRLEQTVGSLPEGEFTIPLINTDITISTKKREDPRPIGSPDPWRMGSEYAGTRLRRSPNPRRMGSEYLGARQSPRNIR